MRIGPSIFLAGIIATQANAGEFLYLPNHYQESLRVARLDMLVNVLTAESVLKKGKPREAYYLLRDRINMYEHTEESLRDRAYATVHQAIKEFLPDADRADIAKIEETLVYLSHVRTP
jgi:hypothetical protein